MLENTITIDYNPYLLKFRIFNNNTENITMFLDDFQNITMDEDAFCKLLKSLTKRRNKLNILFVGHERYHQLFNTAKEKISNKTKKTIDIRFQTNQYCDEYFREKIQKIIDEKLLDNLEPEIENIINQLHDGNLDNIPINLQKLRSEVLRSVKFAENYDDFFNLMVIQDNNQQKLDEVEIKRSKLLDMQKYASSRIIEIQNIKKNDVPFDTKTFIGFERMKYEKLLNDMIQLEQKKDLPMCISNAVSQRTTRKSSSIMDMLKKIPNPSPFSKDDKKNLEYEINNLVENYENILKITNKLVDNENTEQGKFKIDKDDIGLKIEASKKLQEFKIMLLELCMEGK